MRELPVYDPQGREIPRSLWYDDYLSAGDVQSLQMAEEVSTHGFELSRPGKKPWEKMMGVTGHPRGATRYMAKMLRLNGIYVKHEQMGLDGIVHYALGFPQLVPSLQRYKFERRSCVIRNPWHVLNTASLIDRPKMVKKMSKALGWEPILDADCEDTAQVMVAWYNHALYWAAGDYILAENNRWEIEPGERVNASALPVRLADKDFRELLSVETYRKVQELAQRFDYE